MAKLAASQRYSMTPSSSARDQPGRRKMTLQNVSFLDPGVGEEPIRGFGVTPVLAGKRDTSAHAVTQPPQKIKKTSTKPSVLERPDINILLGPMAANSDRLFALNQHFAPR
jgi:hypothetical protein